MLLAVVQVDRTECIHVFVDWSGRTCVQWVNRRGTELNDVFLVSPWTEGALFVLALTCYCYSYCYASNSILLACEIRASGEIVYV